ncbi:FKBP-type peptidyl-prolyl cis-trans isomerase [Imperialibacter roseus]|uniref:Peptidyl-prolyl cis-trans isomerase n=1 Tax=Imperialibacter roseus TaxID=1324217 RepID=A0ABZ0IWI9_9BACT|nr:FKBP-type peptidyl-prolyl cis-trans isomerase [Imperialibacter roseus]WOK08290.1 FKBP-type peptidyl-prolyl cis-trans isomerase [Imperialibacter roseus]
MRIELNRTFALRANILLAAFIFLFSSCNKEVAETLTAQDLLDSALKNVDQTQLDIDTKIIDDSLAVWGFTDVILTEPQGVRYKIDTLGNGEKPKLESIVWIKYSGKLLSTGEEFDAGDKLETYLYRLIAGFQTTLPLIPNGSTITLYIPSGLGYGANDVRDSSGKVAIPKNSNLIFDIELFGVF